LLAGTEIAHCVRTGSWADEKYMQILIGKHEGRDHTEDIGVDGRIILDGTFGFIWLRVGTSGGLL